MRTFFVFSSVENQNRGGGELVVDGYDSYFTYLIHVADASYTWLGSMTRKGVQDGLETRSRFVTGMTFQRVHHLLLLHKVVLSPASVAFSGGVYVCHVLESAA